MFRRVKMSDEYLLMLALLILQGKVATKTKEELIKLIEERLSND